MTRLTATGIVGALALCTWLLPLPAAGDAEPSRRASLPATVPASLDSRLLENLKGRRQWSSHAVKIWLNNPSVSISLHAADGKTIRIHAWNHNENDYNTAMMRLNEGDVLYALTNAEFEELRIRAAKPTPVVDGPLPTPPEGKKWKLVWNDEFDGTELDTTKWGYRPDGKRKGGYWDKKVVSLDGKGHLSIAAMQDGERYLSGCVVTEKKFEHRFGYFETRVQFQKQPGHWTAFWLQCAGVGRVGEEGRDGTEIDIFEKPSLKDNAIEHNLHWDGYGKDHKSAGHKSKVPGLSKGWHTIGLWWKSDEYVFYVDGQETWRTGAGGVSQVPQYILLSNEIGKWAGDITKAKLPDYFLIDYVRVYDLADK